MEEMKLPAFREKQIRQAFFVGLADSWDEVTVLSKDLRDRLKTELIWSSVAEEKVSGNEQSGSIKAALRLVDGELIETVLIKHKDGRNTVCVSSQVGCPLACAFCATGKSGFRRNLTAEEIVDQILYFSRFLKKKGGKVTNIVYMGMGEPFLNYDEVMASIRILNDTEGYNLGARHFSISTCGIVPGIQKLANEKLQVNLALSMHAPTDKLRVQFMPVNKQYNLEQVLKTIDAYIAKTNRRVMIEYLLIDNVNDRAEDAEKLSELLAVRPLCYANLIPYNEIRSDTKVVAAGTNFSRSLRPNIKKFAAVLEKNKAKFTIRHSFGGSINAACGQLLGKRG